MSAITALNEWITILAVQQDRTPGVFLTTFLRCAILLDLSRNQLSGGIPAELGSLSDLQSLFLDSNRLSGTIPTELGNLPNLANFALSNNQFSRSIPSELGNMSNLRALSLDGNQLSGSIPDELANLSNLMVVALGDCQGRSKSVPVGRSICVPPELMFTG